MKIYPYHHKKNHYNYIGIDERNNFCGVGIEIEFSDETIDFDSLVDVMKKYFER